ncbi:MAG: tyrosine-type recombinase/integrase [Bradyrhizobium sp.]|nr:tyrosine-type recombinase/integrase [Bradyrhizobium sp.]
MSDQNAVGPWVRRFLMEHIVDERNLARNTQASYRDALALILPFAAKDAKKPIDQLAVEDISPDVVRRFLGHLEQDRGCSIGTRNQRLAAVHSWARFIGEKRPEHLAWCTGVCAIPFKKASRPVLCYLEPLEMKALLDAPDRNTTQGRRDHALLLFLYNSGARASEAAGAIIGDLDLGEPASIKITGKGRKERRCPLLVSTVRILAPLAAGRSPSEPLFLNRRGQPITRFGIFTLVERYALRASGAVPSLLKKQVSPHTIRHTTAVHLLRSGVDINTIRAWLGHVSVDTTNIYAEVDLEMKAKALAHSEIPGLTPSTKMRFSDQAEGDLGASRGPSRTKPRGISEQGEGYLGPSRGVSLRPEDLTG